MKSQLAHLIMPGIGAVFLVIGLFFLWTSFGSYREVDRIATLPALTAVQQLNTAQPGAEAVLEGKIAERNPLHSQGFVAYIREEYQGEHCERDDDGNQDCTDIWNEDERVTPALWLDLAGGRTRLTNTDYTVKNSPVIWQSTQELFEYETRRYSGFKINNLVVAQGVVTTTLDGPAFNAALVFGGSRIAYLEYLRSEAGSLFWMGAIFTAIGSFFVILGGALAWFGIFN